MKTPSNRIPELDGLRGTAILLVIFFHFTAGEGMIQSGGFAAALQRTARMGWSGVDLFFVLSGFLIGGILIDARTSPNYFKTFYIRRFFRIIPIYYVWIFAYIVLITLAGRYIQTHSFSDRSIVLGLPIYQHFLFLQNLWLFTFPGITGAWFSHLWSLAVEEQFYLVSPLIVRLLSPRRLPICLAGIVVAAPLFRILLLICLHHPSGAITVLMPCRADTLALGMLAAVAWRDPQTHSWMAAHSRALYLALGFLFAGVVVLWKFSPESGTTAMQSIGFSWLAFFFVVALLIALLQLNGPIARVMRIRWLREMGRVSYCMYIIHLTINLGLHTLLLHSRPEISNPKGLAVTILAAFLTYGIAKLSWIVLEHPLLRRGHAYQY